MCHALIIEDEWLVLEFLAEIAEEAGATSIATAATENEAISAARARTPAIILSDVHLRAGTGPRAVQAIIADAGDIPVIFITGTPQDCRPCDPPGVVLGKPVERNLLVKTFRELLVAV